MDNYSYKIAESIGGRREQQDFSGMTTTKFGLLVVVCDGMGGAKGGATASRMAVNIILEEIRNNNFNTPTAALQQSIIKANSEIFYRSHHDENCRGMGTTVTAIILQKEKAVVAHVGDSRVYQLRKSDFLGKSMQKVFRTDDHSKVFELVKRGILNEEQARVSDESNVILRALGIKPEVAVQIKDNLPYLKGDRFLLCTDGVCGAIPESELLELLNTKKDVEYTVQNLIREIDQNGFRAGGGHDNLTAAIIECKANSILKSKIDMNTKITITSLATLVLILGSYIGYTKLQKPLITEAELTKLKNEIQDLRVQVEKDNIQKLELQQVSDNQKKSQPEKRIGNQQISKKLLPAKDKPVKEKKPLKEKKPQKDNPLENKTIPAEKPTATPEPTATEVPPTATPEPTATATPVPTATEVPPTATPDPQNNSDNESKVE